MNISIIIKCILIISIITFNAFADSSVPNTVGIISQKDFVPPSSVAGKSAWLNIQQIHQETNLCVPTSAAMVLSYYSGNTYLPREIKAWSLGQIYNPEIPFNNFTATYFNDLLNGLKAHSIFWTKHIYANDENGYLVGLKAIKEQLDNSHPVIVDTNLYTGHTFVVAGYDEEKEMFIILDPFISSPGIRIIQYDDFEKIWNSTKVHSNIRAAIFTTSPSEE